MILECVKGRPPTKLEWKGIPSRRTDVKKMPFDQQTLAWHEGHEGQVHRRTSGAYEIEYRAQERSKGNREQSRSSTYNII